MLKDAIQSALNQTYDNFEIIIADDGSSDDTRSVVENFNSERIRYYYKSHSGAPDTRNLAIEKSGGDYILWLGDDDLLEPNILAEYADALLKFPDADILYCYLFIRKKDGSQTVYEYPEWYNNSRELLANLIFTTQFADGGSLFSRTIYEKIGFYNPQFTRAQDYEFACRVARSNQFQLKRVAQPLYIYRIHEHHHLSGDMQGKDFRYDAEIIKNILKHNDIKELFPKTDWDSDFYSAAAEVYFLISKRFLSMNCLNEGIEYLQTSTDLKPVSDRNALLSELKNRREQLEDRYNNLSLEYKKNPANLQILQQMDLLERMIKPLTDLKIYPADSPSEALSHFNAPLVSVVIPCYNQAHFLPEALDSIFRQSYENWEIIIVNDGSTDDTARVADRLIQANPNYRIALVNKANKGLADARNAGITEANGTWILLLDSDDLYGPDFLQNAFEMINQDPSVNVVFANPQKFGAESGEWIPEAYHPQKILEYNCIVGTCLFRKSLWELAGGYETIIPWGAEDWNFWISCSVHNLNPARVKGKHFFYRIHENGGMFKTMLNYMDEVRAMIHTLHPDLYELKRLLADHQAIAAMKPETVNVIEEKISKFPDKSLLYLWRGLKLEFDGNTVDAINDFRKACQLAAPNDWQPFLRLWWHYNQAGNAKRAQHYLNEFLLRSRYKVPDNVRPLQWVDAVKKNTSKKKILIYYAGLPNSDQPFAGTNSVIFNLASKFNESHADIQIDLTGDYINREEKLHNVQFLPLPPGEQIDSFLCRYQIVVFATHMRHFISTVKPQNQNWILYQHCWKVEPQELRRLNDFDSIICLSDIHKASIVKQGTPPQKITVLPNCVDTETFKPAPVLRKKHAIMFAGAVVPHKKIDVLLEAFELVRRQYPDAELNIYGSAALWHADSSYENQLKARIRDGVRFHNEVKNKEMPEIYSSHSLLCLPSAEESFGLVLIESQACGCVPVVHQSGGVAATLKDGETGFLYSPNTPRKLAQTIIEVFSKIDEDSSIREKAVHFIQNNFSIQKQVEFFSWLIHPGPAQNNIPLSDDLEIDSLKPERVINAAASSGADLSQSELNHLIPPEIKNDEFYFTIQKIAREEKIETVLEIGSSAGQGSTEAFVAGLCHNRKKSKTFLH